MIFGKKNRESRNCLNEMDSKSGRRKISKVTEHHENDPTIDPVSAYLSLLSGEGTAWKQNEEAKKEFYRLKYEHEQILCGFAAGGFEYYRKQRYQE